MAENGPRFGLIAKGAENTKYPVSFLGIVFVLGCYKGYDADQQR